MKLINKNWITIIFFISVSAIISAFIAEFIFNLIPCKLCYNQRYSYYFIIGIILVYFIFKKINSIWLSIFIEFAIVYGLFYTLWHVGVEKKIFKGPSGCSAVLETSSSTKDLKNQILNQDVVNCADVSWTIFGISAVSLNLILMLLFIFFNTIYIYKHINAKKKI